MALRTRVTNLSGRLVAEKRSGKRNLFSHSSLGETIRVSNTAGETVCSYRYWPYGEDFDGLDVSITPFRFIGAYGYYCDDSEQLYVRSRILFPEIGRWVTRDTEWPDQPSYLYGMSNPLRWIDFFGTTCGAPLGSDGHDSLCGPYPTHPCATDPCGYAWTHDPPKGTPGAYVACCLGRAYVCIAPPQMGADPAVLHCLKVHEGVHPKQDPFCDDPENSGCMWYMDPEDQANFECLAYREELRCLEAAATKLKCNPADRPDFLNSPNSKRCQTLYRRIRQICTGLGCGYCKKAGIPMPRCGKWGFKC